MYRLILDFDLFDIFDDNIGNAELGMAIRAAIHYCQGKLSDTEEEEVNSIDSSSIYFRLLKRDIDREGA